MKVAIGACLILSKKNEGGATQRRSGRARRTAWGKALPSTTLLGERLPSKDDFTVNKDERYRTAHQTSVQYCTLLSGRQCAGLVSDATLLCGRRFLREAVNQAPRTNGSRDGKQSPAETN